MNVNLFYKMIDNYLFFFWRQCQREINTWIRPVYKIQGGLLHSVVTIPGSRQVGTGYAKSMYRPVARNGVK